MTASTTGFERITETDMPTDKERREVAQRLRERAGKRILNLSELLWCIGCDDGDDAAAWNRLADLLDPTCLACPDVEDTPDGGQFECWSCSVCGNIVSADPDYDTEMDGPAYCEVCGHRIVGKGEPTWL